jgi:uncharacterized membrane protein YhaH (DUF805 family)
MNWKQLLLSYDGRISRQPYWLGTLALVVVAVAVGVVLTLLSGEESGQLSSFVAQLAILYPALCLSMKRWHDRNKSGWWVLINLIPIIGGLWTLVECGFLRGTVGSNDYGPDPLAAS